MAKDLEINKQLLSEALAISKSTTEADVVNYALKKSVNCNRQLEILDLFSILDPDANYNYKKARKR